MKSIYHTLFAIISRQSYHALFNQHSTNQRQRKKTLQQCIWVLLCSLLLISTAYCVTEEGRLPAPALDRQQVPEPLKPWINWVLEDSLDSCPFLYNNAQQRHCSWSSGLNLNIDDTGADFRSQWTVYQRSEIQLPGDQRHWPQQVSINQHTATVGERNGKPVITVDPGDYLITGRIPWHAIPERLNLPDASALIKLSINKQPQQQLELKKGELWLKQQTTDTSSSTQDQMELQVYRRIIDSVPLRIETRITLKISGLAREVLLDSPLLANTLPLSINSELPAMLEPSGQLRLQVKPGRYSLAIHSRLMTETEQLIMPGRSNWPQYELWVFQANPANRLVEIIGSDSIDATQTQLPRDWLHLPAYRLKAGNQLQLKTHRRGDSEPRANELHLQRKLWLDFDGAGFTTQDSIHGVINQDTRLNVEAALQLGQVSLNGQAHLITESAQQQIGIETRGGSLNLIADSRLPLRSSIISTSGWQQDFKSVKTSLNLPPGWTLLATSNIDNVPDSWVSRWSLWDLFFVFIIAIGFARLNSWTQGALVCITLILTWHVHAAPKLIWVVLLLANALLSVIPKGKLHSVVLNAKRFSLLCLVLIILPFAVQQVRSALYPQLELSQTGTYAYQNPHKKPSENGDFEEEQVTVDAVSPESLASSTRRRSKLAPATSQVARKRNMPIKLTDPNANIQTGPGIPNWNWRQVNFSWNGTVKQGDEYTLYFINPSVNACLNLLRVLLVTLLALLIAGIQLKPKRPGQLNQGDGNNNSKKALPVIAVLILSSLFSGSGHAEMPDQHLLDDLKQRLTRPSGCLPTCAQLSAMQLRIDQQQLTMDLQIHAQDTLAFPLPIPQNWQPDTIQINQQAATITRHLDQVWIRLVTGKHSVSISGTIKHLQALSLPLSVKPHWVDLNTNGWQVDGVHTDGSTDQQLHLTRIAGPSNSPDKPIAVAEFPGFVTVRRILTLGLDWQITTEVIRNSQTGAAIIVNIPLFTGETVLSNTVQVNNNQVLVNLLPGQDKISWKSSLQQTHLLSLSAANTSDYHEIWMLNAWPIWHVEQQGIPNIYQPEPATQALKIWHPWPGERVELNISKPKGVAGDTLTIEASHLTTNLRKDSSDNTLTLKIRSSKGEQHSIQLPENARLDSVLINNNQQPVKAQGQQVRLTIKPGVNAIQLHWLQDDSSFVRWITPTLDLGATSVNHSIRINLEANRWLLFLSGPKLGPAILFWGVLIVLMALSFGLAFSKLTPLKHWQWFLLLSGLTQTPIPAMVLVICWLMAMGLKQKYALIISERLTYNLIQCLLPLLTLIAIAILMYGVHQGLLGSPDMQITGNNSSAYQLNWYADRINKQPANAIIYSAPLYVYKLLMLAWALWMAFKLLDLLKWGWLCFAEGGLWKKTKIVEKDVTLDSSNG